MVPLWTLSSWILDLAFHSRHWVWKNTLRSSLVVEEDLGLGRRLEVDVLMGAGLLALLLSDIREVVLLAPLFAWRLPVGVESL